MRKLLFIFAVTSIIGIVLNAQTPYYYYYKGEKQYLSLNTEHAFLSVKDEQLPVDVKQRNINVAALKSDKKQYHSKTEASRFYTELKIEEKLSDEQYLMLLSDIKRQNKDAIVSPYFKIKDNGKIGLSNFFYVCLREKSDTTLLQKMAKQTECIVVEQDTFMPLWFVLSTTEASGLNALECANAYYESGLFQAATPDLMVNFSLQCANDSLFSSQWGLKNTGQYGDSIGIDIKACEAWQISTGNNVTVAVIDLGIDSNHPDLTANIHPLSFDCESGTSPSILYNEGWHGTACAGIIGAEGNNTEGIIGVAPDCQLMNISYHFDESVTMIPNMKPPLTAGINWAWQNGADVISNSWGDEELQGDDYITAAIDNAVTFGRNDKGCIVVFATGNADADVLYPACLPNVIAVGAISPMGQRADFSCYGSALDVVAPGVDIYATCLNYYYEFSGTSAACPHVAGVAALMLSVNPYLKWWEVKNIIETTAQKVGGYNYQITSGRLNGTWNNEMGYGLVDAHAAVQEALIFCGTREFINQVVAADTTVTGKCNINVENVTVTSGAKLTIDAPGGISITAPFKAELGSELKFKTGGW